MNECMYEIAVSVIPNYLQELGWQGTDWIDLAAEVAGSCECSDETLGSIKCGEFLDQLRTCWILKKDSHWN